MMRLAATATLAVLLQTQAALPAALQELIDAERAFAARERVVGWKQAFLEYFADAAIGFNGPDAGPAKAQIRGAPDPQPGVQLLWEPRYGDVAASGDLGWLTGPSTSINPARNNGTPRHGNYASIWKRQADGSFKVVMDVGVNTPAPVTFPSGFTRAAQHTRFQGGAADAGATLAEADRALSRAAAGSQADAYRPRLDAAARMHRNDMQPVVGAPAVLKWLASQPPVSASEHRFAEAAQSGDLGYTWGTWQKGFYVRVWTRGADGAWKVVLDVVQ
jgi:ketosteroid isomerase-like protein